MGYAASAAAVGFLFLCLWAYSLRRRLSALEETVDRALEDFNKRQFCRIDALAALMRLTEQYAPRTVWAQPDVVRAYCARTLEAPALEDIAQREAMIARIISQILQAIERRPEIRSDWRYFQYLSAMSAHESLSRTSRLLYNDNAGRFNRELLLFPSSMLGRVLGIKKRGYLNCPKEETPIYEMFPSALAGGGQIHPDPGAQEVMSVGAPTLSFPYGKENPL